MSTQLPNPVAGAARPIANRVADTLPWRLWNGLAKARWQRAGSPVCVIAFHRVSDLLADDLTFPVRRFETLCRHWKDHYRVISLDELHQRLNEATLFDAPALAITFDDGYANNAEIAAPLLRRLGLPATFFVTTDYIATARRFAWDVVDSPALRMMTWEQVQTLEREGFAIASHTANHVRVAATPAEELTRELVSSRETLRRWLLRPASDFAYPYGGEADCRDGDRQLIRGAGYRSCFSCHDGLIRIGDDPQHLQRIAVSPRFHLTPSAWERHYAHLIGRYSTSRQAASGESVVSHHQ